MLDKAIIIAAKAHQGQLDKGGKSYILHPLRVMLSCKEEAEQICAVLHDVVEDTTITLGQLKIEGFSKEILEVLDCLTKREGEDYFHYIERVSKNKIACRVKLADLNDNMDLTRITNPTQKDKKRVEKYQQAKEKILDVLLSDK